MLDSASSTVQEREQGAQRVATRKTQPVLVTLRALRLRRGWTVRELARQAGLPPATVSRLERGLLVARDPEVAALAHVLDVDLRQLFVLCAEEQPAATHPPEGALA